MSWTGVQPVDATEARGVAGMSIILAKETWSSAETFEATVGTWGMTNGRSYTLDWEIREGNGSTIDNLVRTGTQNFSANSAAIQFTIEANHLGKGANHLYRLITTLSDYQGVVVSKQANFSAFTNTLPFGYSNIIFFGDSLSDMGNSFNQWGTPDSPPYWNGRFSNGEVWAEQFGRWNGLILNPGRGTGSGNNRAYGGAHSGDGNYLFVIPNVGKQVDDFLQNHQINSNELVVIFCGGNDFVHSDETDTQTVVDNIESHIDQLSDAGATEFLIPELPGLDAAPRVHEERDAAGVKAFHERLLDFNARLHSMLDSKVNSTNLTIHRGLTWEVFDSVLNNPNYYGITNTTAPACDHEGYTCDDGDWIAPNAEEFVFFDKMHPTLTIHDLFDLYARELMGVDDTDGDGLADVFDNCLDTLPAVEIGTDGCDLPPPDEDGDGVPDDNDECLGTLAGATVDAAGCSDKQRDTDADGVVDAFDNCPTTPTNEVADLAGCSATQRDGDGDGVVDAYDSCPSSPFGESVASDGCALSEVDRDGDGVMDDADACLTTPYEEPVNSVGCGPSELDDDEDGINNLYDNCPFSPVTEDVDLHGCAASQRDSDSDSVFDSLDFCPNTVDFSSVDDEGCSDQQRDLDDDGRLDYEDDCIDTSGSLRGCPILSIETRIIQYPTDSEDAVIELLFDCESNCSMIYTSSVSNKSSEVQPGTFESVISNPGPGQHVITFRIAVNGTFAEESISLTWPVNQQDINQQNSDVGNNSNDGGEVVIEEGSSFSSNLDPSRIGLFGLLILANLAVLVILMKRRRRRRMQGAIGSQPAALMDQTSLFR